MTRYDDRGYCSLCQRWWPRDKLKKLRIKKLKVYAFYCPVHLKQVRMKGRGKPMSSVKEGRN